MGHKICVARANVPTNVFTALVHGKSRVLNSSTAHFAPAHTIEWKEVKKKQESYK
jgi:hypothetical protein